MVLCRTSIIAALTSSVVAVVLVESKAILENATNVSNICSSLK